MRHFLKQRLSMCKETQKLHAGQTLSTILLQKTLDTPTTLEIRLDTMDYTRISCTSGNQSYRDRIYNLNYDQLTENQEPETRTSD